MKIATTELERALGNLDALAAHIDAMEHTIQGFGKQMEAAKIEIAIMRLDMHEVQTEIRAAVRRLEELRAAAGEAITGAADASV